MPTVRTDLKVYVPAGGLFNKAKQLPAALIQSESGRMPLLHYRYLCFRERTRFAGSAGCTPRTSGTGAIPSLRQRLN